MDEKIKAITAASKKYIQLWHFWGREQFIYDPKAANISGFFINEKGNMVKIEDDNIRVIDIGAPYESSNVGSGPLFVFESFSILSCY